MTRPKGWRYESTRHALAARGVETGRKKTLQKKEIKFIEELQQKREGKIERFRSEKEIENLIKNVEANVDIAIKGYKNLKYMKDRVKQALTQLEERPIYPEKKMMELKKRLESALDDLDYYGIIKWGEW